MVVKAPERIRKELQGTLTSACQTSTTVSDNEHLFFQRSAESGTICPLFGDALGLFWPMVWRIFHRAYEILVSCFSPKLGWFRTQTWQTLGSHSLFLGCQSGNVQQTSDFWDQHDVAFDSPFVWWICMILFVKDKSASTSTWTPWSGIVIPTDNHL